MSKHTAPSSETQSTPPISTPGHLLANIPGILGFYPTESVVFMALDATPRGTAIGPLVRIDLKDAHGSVPPMMAEALRNCAEGVFAFVITQGLTAALERTAEWLYGLDADTDGLEVDAAWWAESIAQGEPYQLLHGVVSPEGEGPMKNWVSGTVAALTSAPSMLRCVDRNVLPSLSRSEHFSIFERRNPHVSVEEAAALARAARTRAHDLRALVDEARPRLRNAADKEVTHKTTTGGASAEETTRETAQERKERILQDFLADVQWWISRSGELGEVLAEEELLSECAMWLSTTWTRDLVIEEFVEAGEQGASLLLAAVRTFGGTIRANALCLFAVVQLDSDWDIFAGPALRTAAEEFPEHRLASLLVRAYHAGLGAEIRTIVRSGGELARKAAVEGTSSRCSSGEPNELYRRAAG
ncbi:DUF4192 domain-containing protein [Corynebacterium sp.]|uniref:DUF4192 domain-containing protein n=1 Tax=Corynebacterium sp. TaxID=1720 RepID=UPI0026DC5E09|nr:DUF4192 domain-containing protein [Corynebacterium sp.]MDO5031705.1 DUF4192 domain-containing protein [Corynebacterium sp.]